LVKSHVLLNVAITEPSQINGQTIPWKGFEGSMKTLRSICISLAALLLLTVAGHTATVINSIPYTITASGNYVLGASLTYSGTTGTAITVNAHNVTIDLNGQYLYNPNFAANSAYAIYSNNKGNITVRNGQIIGFYVGIYLDNPSSGPYNAGHSVEGTRLTNCTYGIFLTHGKSSVFQNNQISTTVAGSEAIGFFGDGGNRVNGNVISGYSSSSGISSNGGNYIEGNTVSSCSTGISMAGTDKYRFNTTFNCTTSFSSGTAVFAENN
jgi:nitrous oxidase accessory protein NosD